MKKFRQFIKEALEAQAGENTGFREVHKFTHKGEEHHAVVNITHNGDGHYKVIARVGKPGNVGFKHMDVGPILGGKIAAKVQGSVETFMKDRDKWNSITLGGIDKHTKQKYQDYAKKLTSVDQTLEATYGSMRSPLSAAVVISKKTKTNPEDLKYSGTGTPAEYSSYDKTRSNEKNSSGSRRGRSFDTSSHASRDDKVFLNSKMSNKKTKEGAGSSEVSGLSSAASSTK